MPTGIWLAPHRTTPRPTPEPTTDESPAYKWIGRKYRAHLAVNHTASEFVPRGPLATAPACVNTAESVNALIKRKRIGTRHGRSIKHPDRYLTEIAFNRNQRSPGERLDRLFHAAAGRLRLRELIAPAG